MTICPWCGTQYSVFQSNCKNCGGPLRLIEEEIASSSAPAEPVAVPPPAPRPISDSYLWRILFTDGWAVSALIFCLLGVIFSMVGAGLTLGIITAFIGIPFLLLGIVFLIVAVWVLVWRTRRAQKVVTVLKGGGSGARKDHRGQRKLFRSDQPAASMDHPLSIPGERAGP